MTNTPTPAFSVQAEQVQALLQQALKAAEDGLSPELTLIQETLVTLCTRAEDLPAAARPEARTAIEGILITLDHLTALLISQRDALQQELGTVTTSKAAARPST